MYLMYIDMVHFERQRIQYFHEYRKQFISEVWQLDTFLVIYLFYIFEKRYFYLKMQHLRLISFNCIYETTVIILNYLL